MHLLLCAYLGTLRELEGLKKEISVHKKKETALILSVQKYRRTTNSLCFQLDFEKMLSEVAAYLISLSGRQFDEGIGYALQRIGIFFAVDHCYLFHFSADGQTIGSTCQWQSAGAIPLLLPGTQSILVENTPWWARQIKTGGHVLVPDVNKLPPEAVTEREQEHAQRVSQICGAIGAALGMSKDDQGELRLAGLLHDLGKITVGESVLKKPGPLTTEEKAEIERHVETGYRILSSVREMAPLAEYILAHHERWDGQGYPRGLKGDRIPLPARIIAIADSYDAMTRNRPYRRAMSIAADIKEIRNNTGTQFDSLIARVFVTEVLRKEWTLEPTEGDD